MKRKFTTSNQGLLKIPLSKVLKEKMNEFLFKLSKRLSVQSEKFSRGQKQFALSFFCIGASWILISIALSPFRQIQSPLTIENICRPKTEVSHAQVKKEKTEPSEIVRINRFKTYLDSLKHSNSGKQTYDSLKIIRPGLMDSIEFFN